MLFIRLSFILVLITSFLSFIKIRDDEFKVESKVELIDPKWSPNGDYILASASGYAGLYIINSSNGKIEYSFLTDLPVGYGSSWSSNGKFIYYREKNKEHTFIFKKIDIISGVTKVVNLNPQMLTNKSYNDESHTHVYLDYYMNVVSSNNKGKRPTIIAKKSKQIYYHLISTKNQSKGVIHKGSNIIWMNFITGEHQVLTTGIANAISPDEQTVYFYRDHSSNGEEINKSELFSINVNTKKITKLTNEKDGIVLFPDVSPDGLKVAYTEYKAGGLVIQSLNKTGK